MTSEKNRALSERQGTRQFAGDFTIHRVGLLEYAELTINLHDSEDARRRLYRFVKLGNNGSILGSHTTYGLGHECVVFVNTWISQSPIKFDQRLVNAYQEAIEERAKALMVSLKTNSVSRDDLVSYLEGVEKLYDYLESQLPVEFVLERCQMGLGKAYDQLESGIAERSLEPLNESEKRKIERKIMGYRLALVRAAHRVNQQG